MARRVGALERMERGPGLDVSKALDKRTRPAIPIERIAPRDSERGGGPADLLLAAVCAVVAAAIWLA